MCICMPPGPDMVIPGMAIPGTRAGMSTTRGSGTLASPLLGPSRHGLCSGYTRAGETGEHLLRRSEGEVVQHEEDFLAVLAKLSGAMDDKGRGHQALLLHGVMRV